MSPPTFSGTLLASFIPSALFDLKLCESEDDPELFEARLSVALELDRSMTDCVGVAVIIDSVDGLGVGGSSSTIDKTDFDTEPASDAEKIDIGGEFSCMGDTAFDENLGRSGSVGISFGTHWEYRPKESSEVVSGGKQSYK